MSAILSRRKFITASLATVTGVAGVNVAARIADGCRPALYENNASVANGSAEPGR